MVSQIIFTLSVLTVVADFLIILLALLFLVVRFNRKVKLINKAISFSSENSLIFIFIISVVATLGSLFLSEIAHFTPCKLCWYQRVFMYPTALISGIALARGDKNLKPYILTLAIFGFLIAAYHYSLQMIPNLPCSDEIASCSAKQFATFGYITIPFMSASAFALIILLSILAVRKK